MGSAIAVLTNPHSGKNRRQRDRRQRIERALGNDGFVRETKSLDELEPAVEELIASGCEYWVCDGGDGTLHWLITVVARCLRRHGRATWPKIIPANGGSIDFVAYKVGIRGETPDIVDALAKMLRRGESPPLVSLDTLRLSSASSEPHCDSEATFDRLGFATAIGGIAQRFFAKLYEHEQVNAAAIAQVLAKATTGALAGTIPLRRSLFPQLQRFADELFAPAQATVEIDGQRLDFDRFASLQIGSIDISLGGVVRTFRHAAKDDVLHAQALNASRLGVVMNLPNVLFGTPIWGREVFDGPARRIRVEAANGHLLDPVIDGERFFGLRSLDVTAGPKLVVPRIRC